MSDLSTLLPYRISAEEIENLIKESNNKLRSKTEVVEVDKGFVELSDGVRYAIKTYCYSTSNLKKLKGMIQEFTEELTSKVKSELPLYLRKEIELWYESPSHIDPHTFDWIEKPTKGRWAVCCRLRQPGNDIKRFEKKEGAEK